MWFVKHGGRTEGPFGRAEIEKRIRLAMLRSLDRVSEDGVHWVYLKDSPLWGNPKQGFRRLEATEAAATGGGDSPAAGRNNDGRTTVSQGAAPPASESRRLSRHAIVVVAAVVAVSLCTAFGGIWYWSRETAKSHAALEALRAERERQAKAMVDQQRFARERTEEEAKQKAEEERRDQEEEKRKQEEERRKQEEEAAKPKPSAPAVTYKDIKEKVAIIECKEGSGTGFLLKMDGKTYLVSNYHVLESAGAPVAKMTNGEVLRLGAFSVTADGRDLARFEVEGCATVPFEESDAEPDAGDIVTLCGNSLGGGVVTESKGFVQGVGPDKIETNAEIVPGNSGSPLVAQDGRVVGVAAFIVRTGSEDWTSRETRYDKPRRFAVRLRGVEWKTIDRAHFERQVADKAELDAFWDRLVPYLLCEKCDFKESALKFDKLDRKVFVGNKAFADTLETLSAAYEKRQSLYQSFVCRGNGRQDFIQGLVNRGVSQTDGEREICIYDEKTEEVWSKVKAAWRDFCHARTSALAKTRRFIQDRDWSAPQMQRGLLSGDASIDWYLATVKNAEDLMEQTLENLNKEIRRLEKGDEYDS